APPTALSSLAPTPTPTPAPAPAAPVPSPLAAPVITTQASPVPQASSTVVLAGSAARGATVQVYESGVPAGTPAVAGDAGAWAVRRPGGPDGSHSYTGRASHGAGTLSAASAALVVVVDTTAPAVTIGDGPSGLTDDTSPVFAFTSDEAGSTFECRLDGPGA